MKAIRNLFSRPPTPTPLVDDKNTAYECAITMDLAELPVYAMDGHLYGLEAIDKWLATKGTSPTTRERIPRTYLRPAELVEGYTAYCKARGIRVPALPVGTIKRGTTPAPATQSTVALIRSLVDRHMPLAEPRAAWPVVAPTARVPEPARIFTASELVPSTPAGAPAPTTPAGVPMPSVSSPYAEAKRLFGAEMRDAQTPAQLLAALQNYTRRVESALGMPPAPAVPAPPPCPPVYVPAAPVPLPKYADYVLHRREVEAKAAMGSDATRKNISDTYDAPLVLLECTDFPRPLEVYSKVARHMVDDVPRTFAERVALLLPAERLLFCQSCICYGTINKKKLETFPEFLSTVVHMVYPAGGVISRWGVEMRPFPLVCAEGRYTVKMRVYDYVTLWAKSEPTDRLRTRLGHLGSDELFHMPYPGKDADELPRRRNKAAHLEAAALYVLTQCPTF